MASVTAYAGSTSGDFADISGYYWSTSSPLALTYSFPSSGHYYVNSGGTDWTHYATVGDENSDANFAELTSVEKDAARFAYANLAEFLPVTFTEITESATTHATLRTAQSDLSRSADTFTPDPYFTDYEDGDSWFSGPNYHGPTYFGNTNPGTYGAMAFIHEFGHQMGLADGFSGSAYATGHNSMNYSIMSYSSYLNSYVGAGGPNNGVTNGVSDYPQSYMMADINNLQKLYGANYGTTAHNGDTVYSWNATTGAFSINGTVQWTPNGNKVFQTIWDGGGNDTLDFSNYTTGITADMHAGGLINLGAQLADLDYQTLPNVHMADANIFLAEVDPNNTSETASLIEKLIGGSGNDVVHMNDVGDTVTGGGGNDTIWGGTGFDTVVFSGNRSNYTTDYATTSGWNHFTDTRSGTHDGADWIQSSGADMIEQYVFGNGGTYSAAHLIAGDTKSETVIGNVSAAHDSLVSLASIMRIDGDPATAYRLWSNDATNGHFVVNGTKMDYDVAQPLSTADLANTYIDVGHATSAVTDGVQAFNGSVWGDWQAFTVTATANTAPTVTYASAPAANITGTHWALSSLATFGDVDGDSIKGVYVYNSGSGHIYDTPNGLDMVHDTSVYMTIDQFNRADYDNSSAGSSTLWFRADDGSSSTSGWGAGVVMATSTSPTVSAHAPTVGFTGLTFAAGAGQYNIGSAIVSSYADADGDSAKLFDLWDDGNGFAHLVKNGQTLSPGGHIELTTAQMADVMVQQTGVGTEHFYAKAWDGGQWSSSWTSINTVSTAEHDPTIGASGASTSLATGSSYSMSSFFTAADSDGTGIDHYKFWDDSDTVGSSYMTIGGVAQHSGAWSADIAAANLSTVNLIAGDAGTSQHFYVQAIDPMQHMVGTAFDLFVSSH